MAVPKEIIKLMEQIAKKLKTWADQNRKLIRKFSASLTGPLPPMDYERVVAYLQINNADVAVLVQGHYEELISCAKKIDTLTADSSCSAPETATSLVDKLRFLAYRLAQTFEVTAHNLTLKKSAERKQGMDEQEKRKSLLEIADEVDGLVTNDLWKQVFQEQITRFFEMGDVWARAITEHKKKVEANPKWKEHKAGPPEEGWIWYGTYGFWGAEFPPYPMDWLTALGIIGYLTNNEQTRAPNDKEKLMIAYFRLAVIHDGALTDPMDKPIYFNFTGKGEFRDCDEWAMLQYESLSNHYEDQYYVGHETRAMVGRALRRVKADLKKNYRIPAEESTPEKPAGTEQEGGPEQNKGQTINQVKDEAGENKAYIKKERSTWVFGFNGKTAQVEFKPSKKLKGLALIEFLLSNKNNEYTPLELLQETGQREKGETEPEKIYTDKDIGQITKAIEGLKGRAESTTDLEEKARFEKDIKEAEAILHKTRNCKGKSRKSSEKYTKSVSRNIETVLKKIAPHNVELNNHLDTFLNRGEICCYKPDKEVFWEIS